MEKKKMNSYVKMIVVMCIGGLIGGIIGFGSFYFGGDWNYMLSSFAYVIETYAHIILWFLVLLALAICTFCYRKSTNILQQFLTSTDDDIQESLDEKYDFWQTFGITTSNVLLGVAFIVFAFPFSDIMMINLVQLGKLVVAFLLCMVICIIYQIASVKQLKKKDPMKYDDAMSFKFPEKYLETCDEGEKQIIYKASHKTFVLMQQITLYILGFAVLGNMVLGTGIAAVVLVGLIYITMTTTYSIYTLKLQKNKI